ncbi:MAG: MerR family transcriptional regulator [Clostridia bacterium]|nr:MerR family transcriptional regulator [Clostridia bacterium]
MRYSIGRIAKMLGLSAETVRTYERKGIVHPHKNPENGYRTFHVLDIGTLLRCRSYTSFGLSLNEAAETINSKSVAETHALLAQQEKHLASQIEQNQRLLNRLRDLNQVIENCENLVNTLLLEPHPGMFRLEYRHNDHLIDGEAREERLSQWASMAPFSFVSLKIPLKSIENHHQDYYCGFGVLEEDARFLGICTDELVECFPASLSVRTIIKVVGEDSVPISMIAPMLDFARKKGYSPSGPAISRMVVTIKRKDPDYIRYYEVWMPVKKTGKNNNLAG